MSRKPDPLSLQEVGVAVAIIGVGMLAFYLLLCWQVYNLRIDWNGK